MSPQQTGPSTNDVLLQLSKGLGKYVLKKAAGAAVENLSAGIVSSDTFQDIQSAFSGLGVNVDLSSVNLQSGDLSGLIHAVQQQQHQHQNQGGQQGANYASLIAELQKLQQQAQAQQQQAQMQMQMMQQQQHQQQMAALQQQQQAATTMFQGFGQTSSPLQQQQTGMTNMGAGFGQQQQQPQIIGATNGLAHPSQTVQPMNVPMYQQQQQMAPAQFVQYQRPMMTGQQQQPMMTGQQQQPMMMHQQQQQPAGLAHPAPHQPSTASQFMNVLNGAIKLGNEVVNAMDNNNNNGNNNNNNNSDNGNSGGGDNGGSDNIFMFTDTPFVTDSGGDSWTYTEQDTVV